MPSADADIPDRLRSQDEVRFFARHYHLLKGLCYAPAGGFLLLTLGGVLLFRPGWVASDGGAGFGLLSYGVLALTVPWAWYMHRRYEAAYGQVRQTDGHGGSPIGQTQPSFWVFGPLLLFGLCWAMLVTVYIPHHTPLEDNHYLVLMAGWLLLLGVLTAPRPQSKWLYGTAGALLFFATLLPLMTTNVVLVQAVNYGLLGAVLLAVGLYNHRLLVKTLGPMDTTEVNADE